MEDNFKEIYLEILNKSIILEKKLKDLNKKVQITFNEIHEENIKNYTFLIKKLHRNGFYLYN